MRDDYARPEGLSKLGDKAYDTIMKVLSETGRPDSGGCKVFYSPAEWKDRGERYGTDSELIVVFDGGDHAPYFNLDYCAYDLHDKMTEAFEGTGVFIEACNHWYAAVYKT